MAIISDYSIIRDSKFTLQVGADIDQDFSFSLPGDAHLGSRSILAFMVYPTSERVSFNISVNNSNQVSFTLGNSGLNTIHEVISANLLKHGNNRIKFVVTQGRMTFADVVLWWQRDV
ncbi:hypothetical protein [Moorena sp. SIO4G3]|uniref:hypothetical protein n=1 Tax=Moorena sp. SIO4G3 TaxID=2607821 RepID=UPI00142B2DD7|nr:hypothetical protein [Moorena sp. SIO4G3]NEO78839.1 hypothetical protein [Moorena sp. SIO4G3]